VLIGLDGNDVLNGGNGADMRFQRVNTNRIRA